jgi:hypothetical protein
MHTTERIVYVSDPTHALFGKPVKAIYGMIEDGSALYEDVATGRSLDLKDEQVSRFPPKEKPSI